MATALSKTLLMLLAETGPPGTVGIRLPCVTAMGRVITVLATSERRALLRVVQGSMTTRLLRDSTGTQRSGDCGRC